MTCYKPNMQESLGIGRALLRESALYVFDSDKKHKRTLEIVDALEE